VHPVPDPLHFFSGNAGNRTPASGSVAKNSDHKTTEAVTFFYITYMNSVRTLQETQYLSVLQPGTLNTRPQRRSNNMATKVQIKIKLLVSITEAKNTVTKVKLQSTAQRLNYRLSVFRATNYAHTNTKRSSCCYFRSYNTKSKICDVTLSDPAEV
jgi:hypothetical protein